MPHTSGVRGNDGCQLFPCWCWPGISVAYGRGCDSALGAGNRAGCLGVSYLTRLWGRPSPIVPRERCTPLFLNTNFTAQSFDRKPEQTQILWLSAGKKQSGPISMRIRKGLNPHGLHFDHGQPWPHRDGCPSGADASCEPRLNRDGNDSSVGPGGCPGAEFVEARLTTDNRGPNVIRRAFTIVIGLTQLRDRGARVPGRQYTQDAKQKQQAHPFCPMVGSEWPKKGELYPFGVLVFTAHPQLHHPWICLIRWAISRVRNGFRHHLCTKRRKDVLFTPRSALCL